MTYYNDKYWIVTPWYSYNGRKIGYYVTNFLQDRYMIMSKMKRDHRILVYKLNKQL